MEAKCDRKMHNFILLRQVEREHRMQHKKNQQQNSPDGQEKLANFLRCKIQSF